MSTSTLEQVKNLVNKLTPFEQARLLEYLTPRIAQTLESTQPTGSQAEVDAAWKEFFSVGDEVAASDDPNSATLTQTLLKMRR